MVRSLILSLVAALAASGALAQGAPISLADLRAKWALPDSAYVQLDDIELHYVDQGPRDAPAIIMLHATFAGLRTLDGLADSLKDRYRVIRFDMTNHGLTGPDGKQENSYARNAALMAQLADHLGIERFALLGTSSGSVIAFRYAADHPDRVTRMVLINCAGLPRTAETNPNTRVAAATGDANLNSPRSRDSYATSLGFNFVPPHTPPDWLIDYVYDTSRRDGIAPELARFMSAYDVGRPQETLAKVQAPTLIVWGAANATLMHLNAEVVRHWMTGAATAIVKVDGTGHYPYLEEPQLVADAVGRFFDGAMDDTLRQTVMVAAGAQ